MTFAAAERAYFAPPEHREPCSEWECEQHHLNPEWMAERDAQAREDAATEQGDSARKERDR